MRCQLQVITAFAFFTVFLPGCVSGHRAEPAAAAKTDHSDVLYSFSVDDQNLLDEIEHACFLYFWREVGTPAQLVRDRKNAPVSSIAAVGFQLSSLPIGVERGWITREQGRARAATVLDALMRAPDNKKFGVYLHYPDMNSGGLSHEGFEVLASTVDHALLMAGAITAAEYFGGNVAKLADGMIRDTNWRAFVKSPEGFLSMGWLPEDPANIAGPGKLIDSIWHDSSDEERLIYFLAAGAPNPDFALDPGVYYRLERQMEQYYPDIAPFAVSWPGALFTYEFSHCWIEYGTFGQDDPARFGVEAPGIDWFENSRRAVLTQRRRCVENPEHFKTLATDRWGFSACAGRDGYIVPELRPNRSGNDSWCEGTVAPYAAGTAIMFTPEESMAALRAFRTLRKADGKPMIWWEPTEGGYGLVDAFNLDQDWASDDYVGIDHGPMLLAIENVRTGLIWKLFMQHETVKRSLERLGLQR